MFIERVKRSVIYCLLLCSCLFSVDLLAVYLANPTYGTPTSYKITINEIKFKRADGSYFTFFEGSQELDIAAVSQGGSVGTIGQGVSLEPGQSYNEVRFTISRIIKVTAEDGGTGYTNQYGAIAEEGGISIGLAPNQGVASEQYMAFPIRQQAAVHMEVAGMGVSEDELEIYMDQSINIPVPKNGGALPNIRLNFDIQDCVEFNTDDSAIVRAVPLLPSISLSVSE